MADVGMLSQGDSELLSPDGPRRSISDVVPRNRISQVRLAVTDISGIESPLDVPGHASEYSPYNTSFACSIPLQVWENSDELVDVLTRKIDSFAMKSEMLSIQLLELGSKWVNSAHL
jgi:hypothetical protein